LYWPDPGPSPSARDRSKPHEWAHDWRAGGAHPFRASTDRAGTTAAMEPSKERINRADDVLREFWSAIG
jgi:hypothetical protein